MEAKGLSYHVNEVRWTQGGHRRGRGPHSINILDSTIKQFIARQDPRRWWDWEYSTSQVKNLLTGLMHTNLLWGAIPLSYVHLVLRHVISVSWPSSFFTTLPLHCIILSTNQRTKTREAWEWGLHTTVLPCIFVSHLSDPKMPAHCSLRAHLKGIFLFAGWSSY